MDAAEEIRSRLSIEDVIGEYVQLKRSGRNWRGLSPFTNERTPSFMVSPEKQIWHDFSSGKGGNMFSFIMEVEGLDFRGTLELLARKAGVDLEQFRGNRTSGVNKEKDKLYELLDLATKFYQVQFSKNRLALSYVLNERKLTKQTALEWKIGYAPNNGTALSNFLKAKGYSIKQMQDAGVVSKSYRGNSQDMFRGRIMIPLADSQGRAIGYTARILQDAPNAPKYINTPQTILYDKSRHVFGLHLAKESIRKNDYAVITEGNMDVIASHGAGVRQVVATAGTALTQQQIKLINRFTSDIRLCFDQDSAGLKATERAIPIASSVGVSLGIITIPNGKDPDELIKIDLKKWEEVIKHPLYAVDWLVERYSEVYDISSAPGKRKFSDIILPVIQKLSDQVEKDHYLNSLSKKLGVSQESLSSKLLNQSESKRRILKQIKTKAIQNDKATLEYIKIQDHLLSIAIKNTELRKYLRQLNKDMMLGDNPRKLLENLKSATSESKVTDPTLMAIADYVKMLSVIYEELYLDLDQIEIEYEAERLQSRLIELYAKLQKQRIADALQSANENDTKVLLEKARQLDELLKYQTGGFKTNA